MGNKLLAVVLTSVLCFSLCTTEAQKTENNYQSPCKCHLDTLNLSDMLINGTHSMQVSWDTLITVFDIDSSDLNITFNYATLLGVGQIDFTKKNDLWWFYGFTTTSSIFIVHHKITLSQNTTLSEIKQKFKYSYKQKFKYKYITEYDKERQPEWLAYRNLVCVPFDNEYIDGFVMLYFSNGKLVYVEIDIYKGKLKSDLK
jgi:hypothetical protein